MAHPVIIRTVVAAATAVAGLAFSVTAQAETVSYDFTARVTSELTFPGYEAYPDTATSVIDVGSVLTGSLSYDDAASVRWGDVDPTLQIDQIQIIDGEDGGVIVRRTMTGVDFQAYTESPHATGVAAGEWRVDLYFPNVRLDGDGSLPSTLNYSGAYLDITHYVYGVKYHKLVASVTSMTTGTSVPELDPVSGAGALALLAGGIAMMYGRRRRQVLAA